MSSHKCRVFKNRVTGYWEVKCYLTDTYVASRDTHKKAMKVAIRHYHKGSIYYYHTLGI